MTDLTALRRLPFDRCIGVATDTEYGEAQPVCSVQGFNEEIGGGGTGRHAKFSTRDSCHGLQCGG